MLESFVEYSLIFIFIFSILVILKNVISFLWVFNSQNGKVDVSTKTLTLLGSAISYIITVLIYWNR